MALHVAIANLTSGGMSGGSRKYLEHVVPLLRANSRISQLDVIVPPQFEATMRSLLTNVDVPVTSWPTGDHRRGFRALQQRLSANRPDVLFIPAARTLKLADTPVVVMMRNMEPPLMPFWQNPLRESVRNLARNWSARQACGQADHVIAVSNFVEQFLINRWHIPRKQVTRIYHGVEGVPHRGAASRPKLLPEQHAGPALFTAGSIRPARGLEDLLRAAAEVKTSCGLAVQLWIAGKIDPGMTGYRRRLQRLAHSRGISEQICWLGELKPLEMSWCYSQAAAFVMTSRAEACPNVALEALAHGCPIVSVNSPPMPEFFPGTTLFYTAGEFRGLAGRIQHLAKASPPERARWQAAALLRASDFSWHRTAQETVALISSLVRREKPALSKAA